MNTSKEHIITLLETNDKAVARALVVLNRRQTADEQASQTTRLHNGQGFTPADAYMGTSMAEFYKRNGYLSPKQVAYWRKENKRGVQRICKYAGQLLEIAQERKRAKTQAERAMAERVDMKNEFAEYERHQEEKAFMSKMTRETEGMA